MGYITVCWSLRSKIVTFLNKLPGLCSKTNSDTSTSHYLAINKKSGPNLQNTALWVVACLTISYLVKTEVISRCIVHINDLVFQPK